MLRCMFIWANHCLNFFLILLNWSDFSVFNYCCWCCFSSCLMHNCIWIKICAELLDDSATLNVMSLELLNVIVFISLKCLFVRIILIYLISDDSFSSLTLSEVFVLRIASVVKLLSFFQQIKVVEIYHHKMFLIL